MSPTLVVKKSPSGGKPKSFAMAVESSKKSVGRSNVTSAAKTSRGRPKRKALVAMYQSQLSENTMGIKIRLKKSIEAPISMAISSSNSGGATKKKSTVTTMPALGSPGTASTPGTSKSTRKRQRKSRQKDTSDSDDSDYEKRKKNNNATLEKHRNRKQTTNAARADYTEPHEQSQWGNVIPEHILLQIFEEAVNQHGSLPTVINIGRVCSLWRRVSLTPRLWHTLDLSTWTKDRSEINLKQIIATHLQWCRDVNLGTKTMTLVSQGLILISFHLYRFVHSKLESDKYRVRIRSLVRRMSQSRSHLTCRLEGVYG